MSISTDEFREKPTVRINYDEFATTADKFVHEGRYVPDDVLPFSIDNCAGTLFDFNGSPCELVGDLGGHAVYRRCNDKSTLRTMDWDNFVTEYEKRNITVA